MMKSIRIVLADDQPFVRKGLRYIIDSQPDMEVVGEAADGEEAVDAALRTTPNMVILDIQMPGSDGISATKEIVQSLPGVKVVLLTTFDVQEYVFNGIRAGAVGYLLKDTETEALLEDIRAMDRGALIYNTTTAKQAFTQILNPNSEETAAYDKLPANPLTDRELEVLQLLAYGRRNHELAGILHVSEGTIKTHIHNIIQKLGVEDRTQAVVMGIRRKLVK
ncbi:response regulator transcription factor [Paenibacillus tyrfis]|uniref:response regulator transcription factor n=1 Tax=Paenibacillus tyrfis TaxID=1501230 RepID=UPI000B590D45|nr:response regulator transcription factor [Paenibacillus tyrfis]